MNKLIENVVRQVLEDFIHPQKNFKSGKGDFQKAGKETFRLNGSEKYRTNKNGEDEIYHAYKVGNNDNYDFNQMVRDIPGVRYPRQSVNVDHSKEFDGVDLNDKTSNEIVNAILANSEKYNDRYIFSNGVSRMLYNGEVTKKDFKTLSDICQYISDNPNLLSSELNAENMFNSKDWANGISNFFGLSFKELKKRFGGDAKKYVVGQNNQIKPSNIITSNGYYVYICYDFSSANGVSSFFTQNMCYMSSDSFFHEHMGDGGVLFMFKKNNDTQQQPFSNFFNDLKSFNELGIATKLNEDNSIIIESITNGNNQSLYNAKDDVKHSKLFDNTDLKDISSVIGNIGGEEVINFCIRKTKERQGDIYDNILSKSKFKFYLNKYYSNFINSNFSSEIGDLILYKQPNNISVCLDTTKKRVFLISDKGFITCNGKQVTVTNDDLFQTINDVMKEFYPKWNGFKYNRRNKSIYIGESKLHNIILESLNRILNVT